MSQNKVLPGVYVNVTAGSKAESTLADRGIAAMGLKLSWGPVGELFYLTESDFRQDCEEQLGYAYGDEEMKGLRDLFKHAAGCYIYRLNGGKKAACDLAEAKYPGVRGNDLQIVVSGKEGEFTVATLLGGAEVDSQAVGAIEELADNEYVCWKSGGELLTTAGVSLSGGEDDEPLAASYTAMFEALEGVKFNTLGCLAEDEATKQLFVQYTKEQREGAGRKFQTVLYQEAADYEGVICVANEVLDEGWPKSSLVYWVVGAQAGCEVNESLTNGQYDGEFDVLAIVGQSKLQAALQEGKFVLHKLNEQLRVLEDINSLVSSKESGEDMRLNQTVRVLDQIVSDISTMFYDKYLGRILNDNAGRVSLWNDIVSYYRKLEGLRAIEGFDTADITVEQGDSKKAVKISSYLTVINAMSQLYLTVTFE